jgi:orotidine-5'-phosphate decarboxylase
MRENRVIFNKTLLYFSVPVEHIYATDYESANRSSGMKPELILALDVPTAGHIAPILRKLPPEVDFFKVGLELFIRDGARALSLLARKNKRIFLDLKLHDIPQTVARAVGSVGCYGIQLLTVHATGGRAMLQAAAEAAVACGTQGPKLVAVTILTSLNTDDFTDLGIGRSLQDQALALGQMALANGIHGLVTSVHEARALRDRFGADPILVTPGIRPAGGAAGDQKRIATPAMAVQAGATYLVVGRPILEAPDPGKAAAVILLEINNP